MSFHNTGNPVPSIDPRDLDDNAKHIDELTNSTFPTFVDRTGTTRRTLAGIEQDNSLITAPSGSSLVGVQQSGAGAAVRSAQDKFREGVTPQDYAAVGDGVTNDDAHFADLQAVHTGKEIDLLGLTYLVTTFPIGNRYYNGRFKRASDGLIMSSAYDGVQRTTNANVFIGRSVAAGVTDLGYADPGGTGRGYGLTAVGPNAMGSADNNTYNCSAYGTRALFSNKYGIYNDAFGGDALFYTLGILGDGSSGTRNAVFGTNGMRFNTQGRLNAGFGRNVNQCSTIGVSNSFFGVNAAGGFAPLDISGAIINPYPRTASFMTGVGQSALFWADANYTTGLGYNAGYNIKKGTENTAIGASALENLERDTSPDGFQLITSALAGTWAQVGNVLTFTMTAHGMLVGYKVMVSLTTGAPLAGTDSQLYTITAITADTWQATAPDSVARSGTCNRVSYTTLTPVAPATGNTATGYNAMLLATVGNNNTANGAHVLRVSTGNSNTMTGALAANVLASGNQNTGDGYSVMRSLTSGNRNTGQGEFALGSLITGDDNTGIGRSALRNMQDASPATALTNCIGLGIDSRVSGNNQAQIGNSGTTTYVYGTVQNRSDLNDKAEVGDTTLGLDFIMSLRPVDYKWDMREDYIETVIDENGEETLVRLEKDGSKKRNRFHHGFIAQEVEKVIQDSGVDFGGFQDHSLHGGCDVKSLGYDEFIAPLVKAVQELTARIKVLEAKE